MPQHSSEREGHTDHGRMTYGPLRRARVVSRKQTHRSGRADAHMPSTVTHKVAIGKNIGQQYCWCSLMWLMPLRSLSNCDYELNFYLRLILGPIHSNQVMGTDPVGSYHGTRNSRSKSVNPTYRYQSHN